MKMPTEQPPEDKDPKKGSDNAEGLQRWVGGRNAFRVVSKKGRRTNK